MRAQTTRVDHARRGRAAARMTCRALARTAPPLAHARRWRTSQFPAPAPHARGDTTTGSGQTRLTCVLTSPSAAKGRSSPARRARRREAGCSVVDEHPPVASLAARQDGLSRDDAFRCAPTSTTRARREHDASTTRARRTRQRIDVRADEPERSEGTQFTGAAWTEARSRMLRRR